MFVSGQLLNWLCWPVWTQLLTVALEPAGQLLAGLCSLKDPTSEGECAQPHRWLGALVWGGPPELDLNAEGLCHMKTSPTSEAQGLRQESSFRSLSRVPWEVTVKPRRTRSPALMKGTTPTPTFNGLTCLLKTRLYPSLGRTLQTLTFVIIFMVGKVMVKLLDRLVELPAGWGLVLNFPTHLLQDFKRGSQKCTSLF